MKLAAAIALLIFYGTTMASEISFGTGEDKDCSLARALAIKDALERHSQHEFDLAQRQVCTEKNAQGVNCVFTRQLVTEVAGTLKRVVKEDVKQKRNDVCVVEVKVEIEKTRTYFGDIKGDTKVHAGTEINFQIKTFEPLYVYLFNIYNRDEIVKLYPYENFSNNLVDGVMVFPEQVKFYTHLKHNSEFSKESLMVLFTKHKLTFKSQLTSKDIYDTIASIPVHSRKIVYHNFEIIRR